MTSYPNDPTHTDRSHDPREESFGAAGAGAPSASGYTASSGPASGPGVTGSGVRGSGVTGSGVTGSGIGGAHAGDGRSGMGGGGSQGAMESLREPAQDVTATAKDAGQQVAETAKGEARQVLEEGKQQGRRVLDEGISELRDQAATVQSKMADTMEALADELRQMTNGSQTNGTVTEFAHQARGYTERAASWLRSNDLDTALFSVRRFAARNPWGFLAIAGGAGLLAGRLARGLRDADQPGSIGRSDVYGGSRSYEQQPRLYEQEPRSYEQPLPYEQRPTYGHEPDSFEGFGRS